jgi:hypothetical protein
MHATTAPRSFDGLSGALPNGMPRMEVPHEVLDSIRENKARCVADRRCSLGRASAAVLHLRCGHALLQDVVAPTMHTALASSAVTNLCRSA